MVAVPTPALVTTPDVPTVATDVLVLLQVPYGLVSLRVVPEPLHMVKVPVIAVGAAVTDIT